MSSRPFYSAHLVQLCRDRRSSRIAHPFPLIDEKCQFDASSQSAGFHLTAFKFFVSSFPGRRRLKIVGCGKPKANHTTSCGTCLGLSEGELRGPFRAFVLRYAKCLAWQVVVRYH